MIRFLLAMVAAAALTASTASAGSWVFQRSYYSHDPVTQVRLGRQVYGGPYYTRPVGAYVKSGYRNLRSTIQVGGGSYDHVNVWESWIQYGEQW
jgi:hypothetical protein